MGAGPAGPPLLEIFGFQTSVPGESLCSGEPEGFRQPGCGYNLRRRRGRLAVPARKPAGGPDTAPRDCSNTRIPGTSKGQSGKWLIARWIGFRKTVSTGQLGGQIFVTLDSRRFC